MSAPPPTATQAIARNRMRKAMALADTLQTYHFTLDQIEALPEHGWHIVATAAGVKPPSADTQALVIQIFGTR